MPHGDITVKRLSPKPIKETRTPGPEGGSGTQHNYPIGQTARERPPFVDAVEAEEKDGPD